MILITGGSGFLGEKLIENLYPKKIRVVARNEGLLVKLKQKFPKIETLTGDVADEWIAKKAMRGVREVYHLAAMKGVDIAEQQVFTAINTNIIGTFNLLLESLNQKPKLFLFISTDKAAQVKGVYGATKFLCERLMQEAETINPDTKYRTVRYGNVLYSTGSVLCKWKEAMQQRRGVKITEPNMTRFFWTRDDAIKLIFSCIRKAKDATPYIPKMKAMRMGDLLEAMMEKYGRVKVEIIGNRGGENLHETMDGITYSNQVPQYTVKEIKKLI
jgi:UDP-N-acetylglucosamine 4,6-dehydratase/UDP-glucose 4-epimerase